MRTVRLAVLSLGMAAALGAAPPLSLIQDVLYKADGTRFDGIAQIEWKSFQAVDGSQIPQHVLNVRITSGSLRVLLVPTTDARTPALYTIKFNTDGRTQFTEYWAVPSSAAPLRLQDVRTQAPGPGGVVAPGAVVAIGEVTGLRTELDLRPSKGANYSPNRAAIINGFGAVDAAIGSPADCLRVDGSTGPCGGGTTGSTLRFVDGEHPAGAINGVNTAFKLTGEPSPALSLSLFRNGVLLRNGTDYTLSGASVLFAPGSAPSTGDRLDAWYRLASTSTADINFADAEVPNGVINGVNTIFGLAASPLPASSLRVYRNGLLQKAGVDYTLTVNTVVFLPVSVPGPGDILQVWYRY